MHCLMSCMKDEGPFVLEFVAHHLVLGFDRIMIATNACRDGSDTLLSALHAAGYVQHLDQTVPKGEIPQHAGYTKLRAQFGLDGVDWLMMLDADEFLHVSIGDGTVQALTARAPAEVDIIALNALTFGTSLGELWAPGRVCTQFTYRFEKTKGRNGMIKSLTRAPQRFKASHNHHMVGYRGAPFVQVMRGDGTVMPIDTSIPLWKSLRVIKPTETCHDVAHYNHYAVKAYDSFALRRDRGRGAQPMDTDYAQRHTDAYFEAHMSAGVLDEGIFIYADRVKAKMAEMLAIPSIAAAHDDVLARYGAMVKHYH